jgi:hypothetical protein
VAYSINWGFAGGGLIRFYNRCREQSVHYLGFVSGLLIRLYDRFMEQAWDLQAGCLFASTTDALSTVSTFAGEFQAGCLFPFTTGAGRSNYIDWGFSGGLLIRLYDRCMEQ